MMPSGKGANFAMMDGAELAQAIAARPDDPEAALLACEQEMFSRSAAAAYDVANGIAQVCFGDAAPQSLVDFFTRATTAR